MQLTPSKNPEKESKNFAIAALVCGIISLVVWFAGLGALAFGIRAAILSKRVKSTKYLAISVISILLGMVSLLYYLWAR